MFSSHAATSLRRGTQSNRVAVHLERAILEGALGPGEKLKSERELASEFHVSQKVIFNAKNILERKHLITRVERKGVFVRGPESSESIKEVLLFGLEHDPAKNVFVREMLGVMQSPYTEGRMNFTVRLVSTGTSSGVGLVGKELRSLRRYDEIDCCVVFALGLLRRDVEEALQLPFPVIFAGDFVEGDYDDLRYLRVSPTTRNANRCVVDYACGRGYRRIAYIYAEDTSTDYMRSYYEEFRSMALSHGIETVPLLISGADIRHLDRSVREAFIRQRALVESVDLIVSRYFRIPDPGFPLPDTCYLHDMPGMDRREVHTSFDCIHRELCEMIFHISDYRDTRRIVMLDLDSRLETARGIV